MRKKLVILFLLMWSATLFGQYGMGAYGHVGSYIFDILKVDSIIEKTSGHGINIGKNALFVDQTNGGVGIGTTSPAYKFDVSGDINYTGTLYQNGSPLSVTGLWSTGTGGIYYNSGGVCIGTTTVQDTLTVDGGIYVVGDTTEVAGKNKYQAYLSDVGGDFLIYQNYYWDGSNWISTNNYGFGNQALQNNSGSYSNGFGNQALRYNSGSSSNGFGHLALYNNSGSYSNGFGYQVLYNNSGAYSNGFGHLALYNNSGSSSNGFGNYALQINSGAYSNGFGNQALYNNSGSSSNGFGYHALRYNSGAYSNGFGNQALQNNSGSSSNGFGYQALYNNSGSYSNGFGYLALYNNSGSYSNGFGNQALRYNSGSSSNGFGYLALQYNSGNYNTAVGGNAFNTFNENTSAAKNISSLDVSTQYAYVPSHNFGSVGDYINLKISTDGTLPSGLDAGVDQWKIIHADTLQIITDSFTDAGSGTHTLTPQYIYENSTAIGYDAEPDASNQVMLGNTSVTQVKSSGNVYFSGTGINYLNGSLGISTTSPDSATLQIASGVGEHDIWLGDATTFSYADAGDPSGWITSSTRAIKENIFDYKGFNLANFRLVKPKTFNYKKSVLTRMFKPEYVAGWDSLSAFERGKEQAKWMQKESARAARLASRKHLGFIAEDIGLITGEPNKRKISQMELIAILWAKVQELERRIEVLEGK